MFKELKNLWSIPVLTYDYENFHEIQGETVELINQLSQRQKIDNESGVGGFIKTPGLKSSGFDFLDQDHNCIVKIRSFIANSLMDMLAKRLKENHDFSLEDENINKIAMKLYGWYHKTNNGGEHMVHEHGQSMWSGILMVQGADECYHENDKCNGINMIYDFTNTSLDRERLGNRWKKTGYYVQQPMNGRLVIFPGYVPHSATPYYGKKDRIVIAFNSYIDDGEEYKGKTL
jgi:hypothetical protein